MTEKNGGTTMTGRDEPRCGRRITVTLVPAPVGSGGVVFQPYLSGERTPVNDPAARGSWTGLHLGTGLDALVRSVLEGVAFSQRQGLDRGPDRGLVADVERLLRQPVPPTIARDMAFAFLVFGLIGMSVQVLYAVQVSLFGSGKTWIIALLCVVVALEWPGEHQRVVSITVSQRRETIAAIDEVRTMRSTPAARSSGTTATSRRASSSPTPSCWECP